MIRFTLQAELYGLTSQQRQQGAGVVNDALVGLTYVSANVTANYERRGITLLVVEVSDFETLADGQKIFNACRTWAASRATDEPSTGDHSYVRLAEKDNVTRINTIHRAESPGWVATVTTVSLDD